jgi:SAM-dependent methyltransferase
MLSAIDHTTSALPPSFDLRAYRACNPGLPPMSDAELVYHYESHGRAEGRVCSEVHDRASFLKLVPPSAKILEIGPSYTPAFRRPAHDVSYIDVYDTEDLQRRADADPATGSVPAPDDPMPAPPVPNARVPDIDHVWRGERYRELIREDFDVVVAARTIAHQPNLVVHLRDIASVLRPSGMVALAIQDKRYGFDHFLPTSDITDVLEAHAQGRARHAMGRVLADQMMHAHNDTMRHWQGLHGDDPRFEPPSEHRTRCILQAMAYHDAGEGYVDAHAWHFTPDSFEAIVTELLAIKMIPLQLARLYPTVHGAGEFYALLQKR